MKVELILNKELTGELRTPDGPVTIVCEWHVLGVDVMPGVLYSLKGKIVDPVKAEYLGKKFFALFDSFAIMMSINLGCTVSSDGAPKERTIV